MVQQPLSTRHPSYRGLALAALVISAVVSMGLIESYREDKARFGYTTTTERGGSLPFHNSLSFGWAVFLAGMCCLVALAVAIWTNWGDRRSRLACLVVLLCSAIAIGGGAAVLRQTASYSCQACLNPRSGYGTCEGVGGGPGLPSSGESYDSVPCPTAYQVGAQDEIRAGDRGFVALMVVGSVTALAAIGLLLRAQLTSTRPTE